MNVETLAHEIQRALTMKEETAEIAGQVADITPISFDSYKLVGGGEAIVLFD